MSRPCAIPGCTRPAKDHQLMCWPHWCRVPKALNRAIFATVHDRPRTEYRKHVSAAIAAVVAKEKAGGPTPTATCVIPNCRKRAPAAEPFCPEHRA